jgi:cob(I)alamin adenosyltransferase
MRSRLLKATFILCPPGTRLYARRQRSMARINTSLSDLRLAMPKAALTDEQIAKLQAAIDSIQAELEAARQGVLPDRDMILWMIDDMCKIVDSDRPPIGS